MRVLDDQDYKDYRTKVTEVYAEQMRALIGYQADLAKWIFATLILINSGALAGIVSSSRIVDGAARIGAPWFIAGIGTALASGFISWLNTTIAIGIYGKIVSPAAIFDRSSQPEFKKYRTLSVPALVCCAIVAGLVSVACAGVGAEDVMSFELKTPIG